MRVGSEQYGGKALAAPAAAKDVCPASALFVALTNLNSSLHTDSRRRRGVDRKP
jgi:hypothetical protein